MAQNQKQPRVRGATSCLSIYRPRQREMNSFIRRGHYNGQTAGGRVCWRHFRVAPLAFALYIIKNTELNMNNTDVHHLPLGGPLGTPSHPLLSSWVMGTGVGTSRVPCAPTKHASMRSAQASLAPLCRVTCRVCRRRPLRCHNGRAVRCHNGRAPTAALSLAPSAASRRSTASTHQHTCFVPRATSPPVVPRPPPPAAPSLARSRSCRHVPPYTTDSLNFGLVELSLRLCVVLYAAASVGGGGNLAPFAYRPLYTCRERLL